MNDDINYSVSNPAWGSDQNVGFNPGYVNGRDPVVTKMRYQMQLAEQMYGEQEFKQWLRNPWSFFLWKQVIFLGFGGVIGAIATALLVNSFIDSFSTKPSAITTSANVMTPTSMGIVLAIWFAICLWWVATRTALPYMRTKNFVEWKATPEGKYWVDLQLHPEPWDPQFPGYPDKDQPVYNHKHKTYYQQEAPPASPAQPRKRAQSEFLPNNPF